MKKLIINADDFGLSPSVNDAIIQVWKSGNLTSTTMMVNMPGTTHAVATAKDNPALPVGLHFCLTEGKSLSGPSTLTDVNGNFMDRMQLLKNIFRNRIKENDVLNEFMMQLKIFSDYGLPLSHVDSHQHIHMNPFVFRSILPVINEKKIPLRLVYPGLDFSLLFSRPKKFLKQWVMNRASKKYSAKLASLHNTGFISIHDLNNPDSIAHESYIDLLSDADTKPDSVIELMVHPYILGHDVLQIYRGNTNKDSFLRKCANEFGILSGSPLFSDTGFTLTSYDKL
jgi:predicted glycoside hydrolase/deacetylase ChbG (UPF0249 family)